MTSVSLSNVNHDEVIMQNQAHVMSIYIIFARRSDGNPLFENVVPDQLSAIWSTKLPVLITACDPFVSPWNQVT